jgi:phosphoenolpyruvate-protein phosphotransferase/dihydroxyacetone kinase phosphotransfer subunit
LVGIVVVSHSAALAASIVELAREMGGSDVVIEPAGGLDEPDRPLGTDASLVLEAVERADQGDGVVVLMDLGSAVLSAEMARDMLPEDRRAHVRLSAAPVVEGAVGAAAAARQGAPLDDVAREAAAGLRPKSDHLGDEGRPAEERAPEDIGEGHEVVLRVGNPLGLHARPAARFVRTLGGYDAEVWVSNVTTGKGPVPARSLSAVATLGVRRGHDIAVRARGPDARAALAALQDLAAAGFGDDVAASEPEPAAAAETSTDSAGRLLGVAASPGIAHGPARPHRPPEPDVPQRAAEGVDIEMGELEAAVEAVRGELEAARAAVTERVGEDAAAILDAQLLLLDDDQLVGQARRVLSAGVLSAARALADAADAVAAAYDELDTDYQRQRAADVRDIRRRILVRLTSTPGREPDAGGEVVLVAEDIAPADVAALDPKRVRAVVTARGGPTSHAAILARAAGIPAVVGLGRSVLDIPDGTELLVDGAEGHVLVTPPEHVLAGYIERRAEEMRREEEARARAGEPALTRDAVRIEVMANAGSVADVGRAMAAGADGIGLLRTEFLFLGRERAPTEEEQLEAYGAVARAAGGKPVLLRTLDAGGDKPLPFLELPREDNPFLGVRGLRLGLAEPDLLRTQLRAAVRAAGAGSVKIMFPMVTTTEELAQARRILDEASEGLAARVDLGVMVEVPAAALSAASFVEEVDFFSIGTNDLAQYTLAAERGNERVARLADALHPGVLRLIGLVCSAAHAAGKWVGVCGELAADPAAAEVLVGLGVRELSMSPAAVPRLKQVVRTLDAAAARAAAEEAVSARTAADVRVAAARRATSEAR